LPGQRIRPFVQLLPVCCKVPDVTQFVIYVIQKLARQPVAFG